MERPIRNVSLSSNKSNINRSLPKESKGPTYVKGGEKIPKSSSISNRTNGGSLLDVFLFREQFRGWVLIVFRFLFYWMMAIDCWLEIPRASNFTIEFNVSHFSNIPSLYIINEYQFIIICIVMSIISIRCAMGICISYIEPFILALMKAILVFSSQSDNYQHHYLLVAILFTLSLVDIWYKNDSLKLEQNYSCWPLKLLLLEVSVLYFWTSIAKLHPSWLNGLVLPRMIGPEFQVLAKELINLIPGSSLTLQSFFTFLSISTIIGEIFLVFSIHIDRLKLITCIIGISMHVVMGISGLRIGTFSYFMVLLYILRLPNQLSIFFKSIIRITYILAYEVTMKIYKLVQNKYIWIPSFSILMVVMNYYYFNHLQHSIMPTLIKSAIVIPIILSTLIVGFSIVNSTRYSQNTTVTVLGTLAISIFFILASKTTALRDLYTEKATMSIGLLDYDSAISNYKIAERYSREEWSVFRTIPQGANTIDDSFEFIGDLGLFLESKKQLKESLELYQTYYTKYPKQLKIQIGLLRTLQELKYDSNIICSHVPNIQKLATTLSSQTCHSIACDRISKHANYALQVSNQISKLNKC